MKGKVFAKRFSRRSKGEKCDFYRILQGNTKKRERTDTNAESFSFLFFGQFAGTIGPNCPSSGSSPPSCGPFPVPPGVNVPVEEFDGWLP
jgi:hypothetical protein